MRLLRKIAQALKNENMTEVNIDLENAFMMKGAIHSLDIVITDLREESENGKKDLSSAEISKLLTSWNKERDSAKKAYAKAQAEIIKDRDEKAAIHNKRAAQVLLRIANGLLSAK